MSLGGEGDQALGTTTPTTLYRLLKNVSQSASVCFSFSSRSSQSGRTSSAFVLVRPSAREASWPAKTGGGEKVSGVGMVERGREIPW